MECNLLVVFRDGTKQVVKGVSEYGILRESGFFFFIKNKRKSFVCPDSVSFFGSQFDYENMGTK